MKYCIPASEVSKKSSSVVELSDIEPPKRAVPPVIFAAAEVMLWSRTQAPAEIDTHSAHKAPVAVVVALVPAVT